MKNSNILKIIILGLLICVGQYFFFQAQEFKNPSDKPILRVKITNQGANYGVGDLKMLYDVLSEKYQIVKVDRNTQYDLLIDTPGRNRAFLNKNVINIFYTYEAVMPNLKDYDLAIGFNYIEYPNYIRIPFYYMTFGKDINYDYDRGKCNPNKKNFACFLVSGSSKLHPFNNLPFDGNTKRERIFHLLSLYKHVKSGGKYLNNIGDEKFNSINEFMSDCKFVIAYENQSYNGYITEKPFQAYFAGSIPIYFADRSVGADINTEAVIFAPDFKSEDELVEYIKKVDNDDELYCKIWNQQLLKSSDKEYEVIKNELRIKLNKILNEKLKVK